MVATMNAPARKFEAKQASRTKVPLLVGLPGPSGGGKTYSALRLATGMQRVTGGDIYGIDTESRRMCHYADTFKFKHVEFGAPFGPLDYLAAIEFCIKSGAGTVIVDSMSHEHEGPGGVLESHEAELDRMAGNDYQKRERCQMLAWQKPKAARRRLINTILQMPVNFIFCFRAKEKIKIKSGEKPISLGWMPIAGEEFVYEMMVNALLLPNAGGVPTWQSSEAGEKQMIKLPAQFRKLLLDRKQPLDESIGEEMAKWALGGPAESPTDKMLARFKDVGVTREMVEVRLGHPIMAITETETASLRDIYKSIKGGGAVAEFFKSNGEAAEWEDEPAAEDKPAQENPDADPLPPDELAQGFLERIRAAKTSGTLDAIRKELRAARAKLGDDSHTEIVLAWDEAYRPFVK